jgi:DNA polymerase I-like protein with 3'-5' exonuclease and polymerase domains
MKKTVDLMNEFCYVLTQMERNGIKIDIEALERLEREYTTEKVELDIKLTTLAAEALGDTPFSLTSNEDLSMLIFSRKPMDKKKWSEYFNLGTEEVHNTVRNRKPRAMSKDLLGRSITEMSIVIHKTEAHQCQACKGSGKVSRKRKKGGWTKPIYRCGPCFAGGIIYEPLKEVAGFKQGVTSTLDLAAHGYKCNKDRLIELAGRARSEEAKEFLTGMVRFNAITSYLNTYITGIKRHVQRDDILHTQFMQCVTATGRLSSRAPNLHNQPRGGTFPIRQVVISRWEGGTITEGDYAQLEFRVAASLSNCEQAKQDIRDGIDVHQRTADVLTQAGQPTSRQDAKAHTFKPLYGGTSGTGAEKEYYKGFLKRYNGIARWHKAMLDIAVVHKKVTLPTGRVYYFPWAKRGATGGVSGATKIKNYPVQGFATADIVPLACTALHHTMVRNGLKSVLINEVHDSVVVDTYPGEEEQVKNLICESLLGVHEILVEKFQHTLSIPLAVEVKRGVNWLDMDVIAEVER